MRILFCNYEYPPLGGGGGVITAHLAAELATRHEVTVLTSGALGLPPESRSPRGVRIVRVPVPFRAQNAVATAPSMLAFMVAGTRAGRALARVRSFDVVNTHFVLPTGPVGAAVAREAGAPNVLSLHGGDLFDPSKRLSPHRYAPLRFWIRRLLRSADAVVGQSRNTLENMRRFYTPDVPALRIPLGIPRPPRLAGDRARYGLTRDDIVLATVGRLVARKAVHELLAVVAALAEERIRLLVVGAGPLDAALRALSRRLGTEGRVRFLGPVDDEEKFRVLASADAYVSTSQHEGFGLVFLEALACGLPVVAYDHGGQSDFLRDGETGFIVPLNDRARFATCCRLLADRADLRAVLGQRARQVAEEFYIDRCATEYERVFEQVHEAGAGARATARRLTAV
ncbi:MAG TPA: glycosyltransferase family 4 protein [Candidatus Binatia bacterium]|nr:glycosyltransferase family 4 protein [Candidatus Binatia bacterium]